MNAGLIFYISSQTGYCETALTNALKGSEICLTHISAAVSTEALCTELENVFLKLDTVFIIGGTSSDERGIRTVLSSLLSRQINNYEIKLLKNNSANGFGSIIACGTQKIITLPDNPDDISLLVTNKLTRFLTGSKE